jgi:hypothetical protein
MPRKLLIAVLILSLVIELAINRRDIFCQRPDIQTVWCGDERRYGVSEF